MSADDDVVVVVVDGRMSRRKQDLRPIEPGKKRKARRKGWKRKTKSKLTDVEKLIKIAKTMGEPLNVEFDPVPVKVEVDTDYHDYEYLDDDGLLQPSVEFKTEILTDDIVVLQKEVKKKEKFKLEEDLDEDILKHEHVKAEHRYTMLKAHERHSYVEDLRKEHPELRDDEKALIEELKRLLDEQTKPRPIPDGVLGMCEETSYYICKLCGERKQTHIAATRHYQEKHGPRYLYCFACGVDFRSLTNLYKHEKRCAAPDQCLVLKARAHVVEKRSANRPFAQPKKRKKQVWVNKEFPCYSCGAAFSCKVSLDAHEAAHRGLRPFACARCPRQYTSRASLRKHSLTHSEKRFECDHCGAKFYNKPALATHMAKHLGTSRFPCPDCDKVYCSKDRLRLHRDIVHLQRPPHLPCQCCTKRYRRTYDLRRHMLKAHKMKLITKKMFYQNLPTLIRTDVTAAVVLTGDTIVNEEPTDSVKTRKKETIKKNKKKDIRTFLRETDLGQEIECEPEKITGNLETVEDSNNIEDTQNSEDAKYLEYSQNSDDSQNSDVEYVDEKNCEVIEDAEKLNDILEDTNEYQVYVIEKGKKTKKLKLEDIKDQLLADYKLKGKQKK